MNARKTTNPSVHKSYRGSSVTFAISLIVIIELSYANIESGYVACRQLDKGFLPE